MKSRTDIRIIVEHKGYREYMKKNESVYDELVYKYMFELGAYYGMKECNIIDRKEIYKRRKIKTIQSMYRIRERVKGLYPNIINLFSDYKKFLDIKEEIRYYMIKYEMKEMVEWLKEEGILERSEEMRILKKMREKEDKDIELKWKFINLIKSNDLEKSKIPPFKIFYK